VNPFRVTTGTPVGNITRAVTIQELLADSTLVPGMIGAQILVPKSGRYYGIRFADLSQLTINHLGMEFLLSRETEYTSIGKMISGCYRLYSGVADRITPPVFLRTKPNGNIMVERIIGHTHPRPIPFHPGWNQPSPEDIQYLHDIKADWHRIFGPNSEPFGLIFGDPGDRAVIYGAKSTPGNAVPP
jgi:hypothetical protein